MCRACLTINKEMVPFDEMFIVNYKLLTNLEVSLQDRLSHYLCTDCWQTIKCFMDFRTKCIISESFMSNAVCQDIKDESEVYIVNQNGSSVQSDALKHEFNEDYDDFSDNESIQENNRIQIGQKLNSIPKYSPAKATKCRLKMKSRKSKRKTLVKFDINKGVVKMPCGICKKFYWKEKELFKHLECHKRDTVCEVCQENFCDWPEILSHRLKHIPENQRRCHLCSKYFLSHMTMEFHYRQTHYDGGRLKLKCSQCQRCYETPKKLQKHIWSVHSSKVLICDYCSKSFNNKQKLKIHILSHTGYKAYVCDFCGYSCKSSSGLKDHKIRIHAEKKVYCKICKRVFQNQQKHDKHICTQENKLCPICGKEINRSSRMSRHLETHGEEKRHKCDRCPATYKTKTALQVHKDRHDGVRTKHCEYCPAKFYSATVLLKHRRIHTGERPYVCKICQRSFTGNSNLKVHMKTHGEYLINKRIKCEDGSSI
ncbi:unnamed protein product, partial [Iphiclides podalirius]